MKKLIVLSAVLALAGSAHAKTVTVEYTAKVRLLLKSENFGLEQSPPSVRLSDGMIRKSQTLTGTFTYDDTALPFNTYHSEAYDSASYAGPAAAIKLTMDFGADGPKVTAATQTGASVYDLSRHFGHDDELAINGFSADPATSQVYRDLSVELFSYQPAALQSTALPSATIANFDGGRFTFNEWNFTSGVKRLEAQGDITSWHVVSAVPEPSMFAMVAASLGLLAWRRKRAS